jgi:hypothetical protein
MTRRNTDTNWQSRASWAVIGALALGVASFFLDPKPDNLYRVAASAFVGGVLGWMYDLAKDLYQSASNLKREASELIDLSRQKLQDVSHYLDYQDRPLKMLLRANSHASIISRLLSASLNDQYSHIAYVYENQYLDYLNSAIEVSNCFEGVHRQPIRWFKETENGAFYLQRLRDKKMNKKLRIIIVDDEDKPNMEADLSNQDLMNFYWSNTGENVETYWTSRSVLVSTYIPNIDIPDDFALYDRSLLIRYDPVYRTLTFDFLDTTISCPERLIFKKLQEQLDLNSARPFLKIEPSRS